LIQRDEFKIGLRQLVRFDRWSHDTWSRMTAGYRYGP
jgi:hypothetical protein